MLANRLSARPDVNVLLLEAGGSDKSLFVRMPVGIARLYSPRFGWEYETAPQAAMNGRRMYQPRGRLLGGSSSVNAMAARTPTRRLATMADVIHAVFFLLDNPSVNGHDVAVDGGAQLV